MPEKQTEGEELDSAQLASNAKGFVPMASGTGGDMYMGGEGGDDQDDDDDDME